MASIMYVGGRAVGVRAYGGVDPVTKKTRNLYRPLAPDATKEDIQLELERIDRLAHFAKENGTDITIGGMIAFYLDTLEALGHSSTTVSSYRSNARCYIDPFIGGKPLESADVPMFTSLYMHLLTEGGKDGNPVHPNTVIKLNSWLKGAFGFFVNNGECTINPHFALCNKEINLVGSWDYSASDYPTTIAFLKQAREMKIPIEDLITHSFPLDKLNEAMEVNVSQKGIKIAYVAEA